MFVCLTYRRLGNTFQGVLFHKGPLQVLIIFLRGESSIINNPLENLQVIYGGPKSCLILLYRMNTIFSSLIRLTTFSIIIEHNKFCISLM